MAISFVVSVCDVICEYWQCLCICVLVSFVLHKLVVFLIVERKFNKILVEFSHLVGGL